eukprot:gene2240-2762_t
MSDLAVLHFNLLSVLVTGIPMKESNQNSTRAIYDVALLYPPTSITNPTTTTTTTITTNCHFNKIFQQIQIENDANLLKEYYSKISTLELRLKNEILVKWKTNDKKINPETLPCTCVHKITPFLVSSNPSNCLLKHICSGKTVFLVTPPNEDVFTHVLTLHEQEVYMHCLHRPLDIENLVPILDCYTKDVSMYRTRDIIGLIDNSILQPPKFDSKKQQPTSQQSSPALKSSSSPPSPPTTSSSNFHTISIANPFYLDNNSNKSTNQQETIHKINIVAPKIVEKHTRYFPWLQMDTILFSVDQSEELKRLFNPIKRIMLKDNLNNETLDQISKLIQQFLSCTQNNDFTLFPLTKPNPQLRKELYRNLWSEFYHFSKTCQQSPQHQELFMIIEKLFNSVQGIEQPPQQQSIQSPTQSQQKPQSIQSPTQSQQPQQQQQTHQGVLYQNLIQQQSQQYQQQRNAPPSSMNDQSLWKQFDKGKKQAKDDDLRMERERQMKASNPLGQPTQEQQQQQQQYEDNMKKRKSWSQLQQPAKPNNFFNNYWDKKNDKIQPHELDGRLM